MPEKRKRPDAALLNTLDKIPVLTCPRWYISIIAEVYTDFSVSQAMRRRLNDVTRYLHELDDRTDTYAYFRNGYRLLRIMGAIQILNSISFLASSTATLFFPDKQDFQHEDYMLVSRAIDAVVRDLVVVQNADKERQVKRTTQWISSGCIAKLS